MILVIVKQRLFIIRKGKHRGSFYLYFTILFMLVRSYRSFSLGFFMILVIVKQGVFIIRKKKLRGGFLFLFYYIFYVGEKL